MTCAFFPPCCLLLINFQPEDRLSRNQYHTEENEKMSKPRPVSSASIEKEESPEIGSKSLDHSLNPIQKIFFFVRSPVIKYIYSLVWFLLFLALYSWYMMVTLSPEISWIDIVLIVWVFSFFTEELRQILVSYMGRMREYFDAWNTVDAIAIGGFIVGMILRFLPFPATLEAARLILATDLIVYYLRFLDMYSINRELGPKLVMIGRMMMNLVTFLLIALIFIVAYGVAAHAVLYPNSDLLGENVLEILRRPYWTLYGEMFLEEIKDLKEPDCTTDPALYINGTLPRCPSEVGRYAVPVLLAFYVLIVNILLINLLIAIFSYTYQIIQDQSYLHWRFLRYNLIHELYYRPFVAPPFVLLYHILLFIPWFRARRQYDKFKIKPNVLIDQWENAVANRYLQKLEMHETDSMESRLQATLQRSDIMLEQLDKRMRSVENQVHSIAHHVGLKR